MENDAVESTNLSAEYPDVVTGLKKLLAEYVDNGRSTPGTPQQNDPMRGKKKWTQVDEISEYLR